MVMQCNANEKMQPAIGSNDATNLSKESANLLEFAQNVKNAEEPTR